MDIPKKDHFRDESSSPRDRSSYFQHDEQSWTDDYKSDYSHRDNYHKSHLRLSDHDDYPGSSFTDDYPRRPMLNDYSRPSVYNNYSRSSVYNDYSRPSVSDDYSRPSVSDDFSLPTHMDDYYVHSEEISRSMNSSSHYKHERTPERYSGMTSDYADSILRPTKMSLQGKELQGNGEPEKMDATDETVKSLEKMESTNVLDATYKEWKESRKRKSDLTNPNPFQKKIKNVNFLPKLAVLQLNELKPGLTFVLESQSGPPHNPVFEMSVLVNNKKYIGQGKSKQMAKNAAAQAALSSFMQFHSTETMVAINQASVATDVTVDDVKSEVCNFDKFVTQKKNAVLQLNKLKPGLTFVLESQPGPPHNPIFEVSVLVDNQTYIGRGNTKEVAKHAAAQAALSSFVQFQSAETIDVINQASAASDFAMNDVEGCNFDNFETRKNCADEGVPISTDASTKAILPKLISENDKKYPVLLLNELHPGVEYSLKEENLIALNQRFCFVVEVNGKTYEGTGQSKKLAKASVARSVLSDLYQISFNLCSKTLTSSVTKEPELLNFPQTVADQISTALMSTFHDVMIKSPEFIKWKVIAGIAMTKDTDMKEIQIITIGTGTKCISGEHMSLLGVSLNDCHAEIISRRCLKDFFYTNLELLLKGKTNESIFIENDWGSGRFSLKSNIKFHLYISTAPCGDARILLPYEGLIDAVDRHPICNSHGALRSKIASGDGTIPVKDRQALQDSDSILPGKARLWTMSCSDKIASWNVLGLQGTLLSYFIEQPIYLDSVIIGGHFDSNHLQRTLFARFESQLKYLPQMYRLNKPKLCGTTSPKIRHLTKSPNFSVNWTMGLKHAEVVNATTGKTVSGKVSRLAKKSFFHRFLNIYKKLSRTATFIIPSSPFYASYKVTVKDYKEAQKALNSAFAASSLGSWMKKPVQQNEFD